MPGPENFMHNSPFVYSTWPTCIPSHKTSPRPGWKTTIQLSGERTPLSGAVLFLYLQRVVTPGPSSLGAASWVVTRLFASTHLLRRFFPLLFFIFVQYLPNLFVSLPPRKSRVYSALGLPCPASPSGFRCRPSLVLFFLLFFPLFLFFFCRFFREKNRAEEESRYTRAHCDSVRQTNPGVSWYWDLYALADSPAVYLSEPTKRTVDTTGLGFPAPP